MCHGRIAPKSTSTFAVSCVGYGSFFPLVILSTLLGVGHASGESWLPPMCVCQGRIPSYGFSQTELGLSH